ncbi:MAG: CRTAC1 family protein [Bacteroidota bacterium]
MKKLLSSLLAVILFSCTSTPTKFERIPSSKTGITFTNTITTNDTFHILTNEYIYNGGGVGVADLNQDGLQDLIFTGNQVSSKVYLNQGDFTFNDITERLKGLNSSQWFSGVSVADINGDELPDMYWTATCSKDSNLRRNRLWINEGIDESGIPSFSEQSKQYGIDDTGYGVHAAFLDYDLDGDLDLYVLNNVINRVVNTNYRAKITNGTAPNNDKFYKNEGNGTFREVTNQTGIRYEGFGLGLAVGDVNKDSYPDIYVSNDYVSNDLLYINQKDGTFKNSAPEYMSYSSKFSMGNDMADINGDGKLDIITLDMLPQKVSRKKQTINGASYYFYINDNKYGYEHQYIRNMLQLHNGFVEGEMLPFSEVGQATGIFQTEWSWSPLMADFDNDGDKDLLITNGYPKDLTDKDFIVYKAAYHNYLASDEDIIAKVPIAKVSNFAYEQTGDLNFQDKTKEWGMEIPSFSNGAAFVDLDNDGDLDYVVNNIDDEAFVYRNNEKPDTSSTNFIKIALKGNTPNTMAIGTTVELWAGDQYEFHQQYLSRGYISSVEPLAHFGLGKANTIDSIRVIWPGGKESQTLTNVKAGQLLKLEQKDASESTVDLRNSKEPFFVEDTSITPLVHLQTDVIDFFRGQPIIQHKFSQIGPVLLPGDFNNDGAEEILIAGSEDKPFHVVDLKGNAVDIPGLTDQRGFYPSDIDFIDIDGDGDKDVVAIEGKYDKRRGQEDWHMTYINEGDHYEWKRLNVPGHFSSVLASCDFNKDNKVDFFIGSRVIRDSFPLAPQSYLCIQTDDNPDGEIMSLDLGMVTDATWSDYDQDGWMDLIVMREWDIPMILKNEEGKSFKPVALPSFGNKRGFWTGILAADLDGDGDDDYIFGNHGENIRFTVSEKYPMRLYSVDFDKNGSIDPICSAYWKNDQGEMAEYPIHFWDELVSQSPFFKKMFESYTDFSTHTIPDMFKLDTLEHFPTKEITTSSSFIVWNEGGSFTWEKLPAALQYAPLRKMMAQDFNGDGKMDVLFTGNDHSYNVLTGLFDSNRGYVMLGKGDKEFNLLSAEETALGIKGQVGSLAMTKGDDPRLWVGINRDTLRAYHIKK